MTGVAGDRARLDRRRPMTTTKAERGGGPPKRITRWGDLDYLTDDDQERLTDWYASRRRVAEKARAWYDRRYDEGVVS